MNLHSPDAATDQAEHVQAAERFFEFHNRSFLDPLFLGRYPAGYVQALQAFMPAGWQEDMAHIKQPLDFWGLNYYTPARVLNDEKAGYPACKQGPVPVGADKTDIGWEIAPDTFSDLLRRVCNDYSLPPCYITENGACFNDTPVNGEVRDQRRINYLESHLSALADVITEGYPVKGYFAWSLMDNFEWAEGYNMRFGLVHVDYETQVRTIKASGYWYREFAAAAGSESIV